ncbi:hypothetical protein BDV40DRAFT_260225 [Aspergillus tamarii]|uniref:Uncharacterized protein n=1 Tax=Aspergillus tamarii TaxID=41984 RepID=A0A5N6V1E3_ASPTM|nr:hypothetical protein BDV40DRAFT_260225 [Aspergillus tamarii]
MLIHPKRRRTITSPVVSLAAYRNMSCRRRRRCRRRVRLAVTGGACFRDKLGNHFGCVVGRRGWCELVVVAVGVVHAHHGVAGSHGSIDNSLGWEGHYVLLDTFLLIFLCSLDRTGLCAVD